MSRDRKTPENSPARPEAKPAAPKGGARKAYAAPKVRAYGNIRDITLGTGATGTRDSAPGSHKTNT
jgi:pyruvate/2-oxoglutarate dehydrogenase complex dihydrolipoamide acyltransferase (E2) component